MRSSLRTITGTLALTLAVGALAACTPLLPGGGPPPPADPCAASAQSVKSAQSAAPPVISPEQAAGTATASAAKATVINADGSIPIAIAEQRDGRVQVHTQSVPDAAAAGAVAAQAATDTKVVAVEAVQKLHAEVTGPDPLRPRQWALNTPGGISFEQSWTRTIGCTVTVGVIDTGVQETNPDLAGRILQEYQFRLLGRFNGFTTGDPNGHGTHVAGIIAAQATNGVGIEGAAPGVKIQPVQVLGSDGSGFSSDVANGISWAVGAGVQVINLSLGGADSAVINAAIDYAHTRGVVVVAAAGNTYSAPAPGTNAPTYPAASGKTIAVAATTNYGTVSAPVQLHANYSTTGAYVSVAAPGTAIVSTYGTGWATLSGTSMATPYVSAAAALIRSAALQSGRTCDQAHVLSILQSTATDDIFIRGRDNLYGAGMINPALALTQVPGSC